jgi:hypothetical protein
MQFYFWNYFQLTIHKDHINQPYLSYPCVGESVQSRSAAYTLHVLTTTNVQYVISQFPLQQPIS